MSIREKLFTYLLLKEEGDNLIVLDETKAYLPTEELRNLALDEMLTILPKSDIEDLDRGRLEQGYFILEHFNQTMFPDEKEPFQVHWGLANSSYSRLRGWMERLLYKGAFVTYIGTLGIGNKSYMLLVDRYGNLFKASNYEFNYPSHYTYGDKIFISYDFGESEDYENFNMSSPKELFVKVPDIKILEIRSVASMPKPVGPENEVFDIKPLFATSHYSVSKYLEDLKEYSKTSLLDISIFTGRIDAHLSMGVPTIMHTYTDVELEELAGLDFTLNLKLKCQTGFNDFYLREDKGKPYMCSSNFISYATLPQELKALYRNFVKLALKPSDNWRNAK